MSTANSGPSSDPSAAPSSGSSPAGIAEARAPAVATTATEATSVAIALGDDIGGSGGAVGTGTDLTAGVLPGPGDRSIDPDEQGRSVERGMLLMAVGVLLVPGIDVLAKLLSQHLPVSQVVWSRVAFHIVVLGVIALVLRRSLSVPRNRIGVVVARGLLITIATGMFFTALSVMPLADAIAIFFIMPLLLTVMATVFLGEPIGWRRVTAILVGLGGAMLVIQPSFAEFGTTTLFPAGAALCFATYLTLTRRLAAGIDPIALEFLGTGTAALLVTTALVVGHVAGVEGLAPVMPTAGQWVMMVGLGTIAAVGHLLIVQAFVRAPAGVLAPFQYLEIVGATTFGYLVFDDFPDATTWAGVGIIVGSGLYVFHRERRRRPATSSDSTATTRPRRP